MLSLHCMDYLGPDVRIRRRQRLEQFRRPFRDPNNLTRSGALELHEVLRHLTGGALDPLGG